MILPIEVDIATKLAFTPFSTLESLVDPELTLINRGRLSNLNPLDKISTFDMVPSKSLFFEDLTLYSSLSHWVSI